MNTKALQQFLSLAQTLHYGRASQKSNISISALSRNIRQLEEEVGTTLFTRDNRSVSLTAEGKVFESFARETLSRLTQLQRDLTDQSENLHGEISLYCSVTASYSILFDLLNQFRPTYPEIDIKLETGDPEHAISRILSGQEEICIAALPDSLHKTLNFLPITKSPLVFIAASEHSELNASTVLPDNIASWASVPMILSQGGVARARVNQWFKAMNVSPRIYAQVAGNEAIVSMVSLGLGVGVVPKIVLDNSPLNKRVRILSVTPQLEPYELGVIVKKQSLKNPLVRAFWSTAEASQQ